MRFTKTEHDKYFEIESRMNAEDKLVAETYFYKNELESRIYDYREKLTAAWSEYTKD